MGEDQDPGRRAFESAAPKPRDGGIDFSGFSREQLQALRTAISLSLSPQDYQHLLAELARRDAGGSSPSAAEERWEPGRFTAADGWRGWWQALRRRAPLFGPGAASIAAGGGLALRGGQRTWLGAAEDAELAFAADELRHVAVDGELLRFEFRRPLRPWGRVEFTAASPAAAARLAERLPRTPGFEQRWSELRAFNLQLAAVSQGTWVTTAIVAANFLVFIGLAIDLAIVQGHLSAFDVPFLLRWGANYGPMTAAGQWWRPITALFLHLNVLHLLLNMWAFWHVGRLTERLFGHRAFAFLYLGSGVLASLASTAWNPALVSVGASGAIFGIFGAFLACLSHRPPYVPPTLIRAHALSTVAFVLFSLINGMAQAAIDNAAHVGGLAGGFALGLILMRPLDAHSRAHFPAGRAAAALACCGALCLAALWQVHGLGKQSSAPQRFIESHEWYVQAEGTNLREWQELANRATSGTISDADLAVQFEQRILPFWKQAHERLKHEKPATPADQPFEAAVVEFVDKRLAWAQALVRAAQNEDATAVQEAQRLMAETDAAQANLERFQLRVAAEQRLGGLAASRWVTSVRTLFARGSRGCVRPPGPGHDGAAGPPGDGPAQRDAAACRAQHLFLDGHYAALDAWLARSAAKLGDLGDGSSTLQAIESGLSALFRYGGFNLEELLQRTSDWRRAVDETERADLAEAMVFSEWAWAARGGGYANSVTQQTWALFRHRNAMAAAALREIRERAQADPAWYAESIAVGLDQSQSAAQLRGLFDAGARVAPQYWPLYRAMLRALMPRWGGSYEKVDGFIRELSIAHDDDRLMYARLYWLYADLEQDDRSVFRDGLDEWRIMRPGFEGLRQRYPGSGAVLNAFARFACAAGDLEQYRQLRAGLEAHPSPVVWSEDTTLKDCDHWLHATRTHAKLVSP